MLRWMVLALAAFCAGCVADAPVTEQANHEFSLDGHVTLNGETIRYVVPEGRCLLDPKRPMEEFFYDTLAQIVEEDGKVFALFAECDQLELLRNDLNSFEQFDDFGGYYYPLADDGTPAQIDISRSLFARLMASMASTDDAAETGDEVAEKLGEVLADPSSRMVVQDYSSTGHTEDAAYFQYLSRNTSYETEYPVSGAFGVTLVHNQIIGVILVRTTDDPVAIDAANEDIRALVKKFLAANPDSDN